MPPLVGNIILQKYKILSDFKKEPVHLGLAAPGNQRNTLLQAPLAETGSRPIRLISASDTQNGNRNTLFLIFTFPPGTPVHQEGCLEKLQQAHR